MKILTTIHDLNNLDKLIKVADGFIIGNKMFSKALTKSFDENINEVIKKIKDNEKLVFVLFNGLYTNQEIKLIKEYVKGLDLDLIDGFIGGDLGLIKTFKSLNLNHKFVYNPETLLTNYVDFNYFKTDLIKGAFVSKEITLDDIYKIGLKKEYELFLYGHGHMSMFYSKRKIVSLFTDNDLNHNISNLTLKEDTRDELFPIYEDDLGTHVFRGEVLSSLNALDKLNEIADYLIVDTLFQSDEYALDIIPLYKNKVSKDEINKIKQKYNEVWHEGFLFEKSIIKEK